MEKTELKKRYPEFCEKSLEIALARHAAMSWIEVQQKAGYTLEACYREGSKMEWRGRYFGQSTLEGYWRRFHQDGFDALVPSGRSDAGKSRVLTPELLRVLEENRRNHPNQTVKEFIRLMIREKKVERPIWDKLSTIYRYFRQVGLDQRTLRIGGGSGPTKAFEMESVNELWMSDVMVGPVIKQGGEKINSRLIALIDDASRLIPYAEYRANEKEEDLWVVLMEGMERRGVPEKLYTDNGKIFTSIRTKASCARLGIRLLHAKAYAAWSKGKIEKWFQTVQSQFESRLKERPAKSLEELNERFWKWLEEEYHQRVHSSLGRSPAERFLSDQAKLRLVDREKLGSCFWFEQIRRVKRDGTVGWKGEIWEVQSYLRGLKVILRYNPLIKEAVEVWHDGKRCGELTKLDRQLNGRTFTTRQVYE